MLATENLRDGATPDPRRAERPSSADADGPRVCVAVTGDGARFETTIGAQSSSDQTIVADGVTRPVSDAECTGTKRSQWSKSGVRLFQFRGSDLHRSFPALQILRSDRAFILDAVHDAQLNLRIGQLGICFHHSRFGRGNLLGPR